MRVECWLLIPKDRVVDTQGACYLEQSVPQPRHVQQVHGTFLRAQGIQGGDNRVRQQQRVTAQKLPFPEESPARVEPGNDSRLASFARRGHHTMDDCFRLGTRFTLHAQIPSGQHSTLSARKAANVAAWLV